MKHSQFYVIRRKHHVAQIFIPLLWTCDITEVNHKPLICRNILVLPGYVIKVLPNLLPVAQQYQSPLLAIPNVEVKLPGDNLVVYLSLRTQLWYDAE